MANSSRATSSRAKFTVLASSISAVLGMGGTYSTVAHGQDSVEEVVVTGSRIVRRDLNAPSPIMTVDSQRLENSSTLSVETILNQMPQFTPAQSQFSAQGEIQTSPTASLGIGTVNLRGVSTNRTLVLIDGRRAQPANASLVVDLNTIPSAAIERIETITGGASAVYGADALAGVVNFVLRDNYEGVSFDVQRGFTEAGDGEETRFSTLLGLNSSSGDANMLLGVEWYEREASFQKNRDFYTNGWYDPTNIAGTFFPSIPGYQTTAANRPTQAAMDALFPQFAPGTVDVTTNPVIYFNPDGSAWTRNANRALGFDDSMLGRPDVGDGYYGLIRQGDRIEQIYMDGALSSPLERRSAFGKAHVDINDHFRAFVQANYSRSEVSTFSAGPPPAVGAAWGGSIPNDPDAPNTRIPAGLQSLLDSRQLLDPDSDPQNPVYLPPGSGADQNWQLNRGLDFLGQFGPTNSSDVYQIMAGVEGSLPNRDWTWEAYYSSGKTDATNIYYGLPSLQRWLALVGSPNFGEGQTIPSATGGNYQMTCTTGLPIFYGTTAGTSADCVNAIVGRYKSVTEVSQDIFEANLQGKITDMSAGELRFAAGITHRKNGFTYEPANPQASIFDAPLGLFVSNPTEGETKVWEVYGELLVPVTERLDLEVGYRFSDYDTAADKVGTYKALFDWSATDWLRVRGGFQRANRAPNTAELFQSETTVFQTTFSSADPCASITLIPGFGNRADNPNRLQVQELCAALIGNTTSDFGAPGSVEANTFLAGNQPFTGINTVQVGNPNLESEEAKTWTLGIVLASPGNLDGLTASLDFYSIEITDAIATFDGQTIYNKCFNRDGLSNPTYSLNDPGGFCALINRSESTGAAGTVDARYLNTGLIETSGVDVAVNWITDLPTGGSLYVNNMLSFLNEFNTQTTPTDPMFEYRDTLGNGGQYKYRLFSTLGYNFSGGNANIGLRWRHLPEVKNAAYVTNRNTTNLPTDSYNVFDLFAGYSFGERYQLRGGIDNLFDTDPAVVGATPVDSNSSSTLPGYYDTLGRRAYLGLKVQF